MSGPRVSFVVPAYDEQVLIGRTLEALHAAAGALDLHYEIVVADDASADRTAEIAAAHGARVVHVQHRQIAATRNAGARAASGDVLVFVDADTVVPAATLAAALRVIAAGGVAGGSRCRFDGKVPLWARVVLGPLMLGYRLARLTPGAFLFCTRQAFEVVRGFDERLFGGEEVVFARALDRYARTRGKRFTIVRAPIITSGRKLRAYSGFEILRLFARLGWRGWRAVRTRELLGMWYGPRRKDPAGVPSEPETLDAPRGPA